MISIAVTKNLLGSEGPFTLEVGLTIAPGSLVTLYGKSGSGKTTLLRMLAGLEKPTAGRIEVNGKVWFNSLAGIDLPPQRRKVGMVFQDYSLFPTMTVRENLRFAQARRNEAKVDKIIHLTGLTELHARYPSSLSGGQQQRVALARAIVSEPDILLLDEPLSALDHSTRSRLQDEILRLHRQLGLSTLLVSHDKQEVFKLSDTVAVIEQGRISRYGSIREVFLDRVTSNKFSFVSTILDIRQVDAIYLAVIGVGNDLVEVVLCERDLQNLSIGDEVLVASKAFNPIVKKL
jgi:molybdate transport system ATP-binding protein